MKLNERGATLEIVLLVILIFSILGIALMGSVVNENKQVNVTESDVQARYLAENGLIYFEQDFNNYIKNTDAVSLNIGSFLNTYSNFKSVGEAGNPDETKVKAVMDNNNNITVTSIGTADSITKTLVGHYKLSYDDIIKAPSFDMMKFDSSGTIAVDFSQTHLAKVGLLDLVNLNVLNLSGSDQDFYLVPSDNAVSIGLLGPVLGINLGGNFDTMKNYRVIAISKNSLLTANLLNVATIDLLSYQNVDDVNVLINGKIPGIDIGLLGVNLDTFKDIEFKKLAVMGNAIIQQAGEDTAPYRNFTFNEGLYVNKSLVIGGSSNVSTLHLSGNMVAMQDFTIDNAALTFSGNSNLYVWGNATIENSTINIGNGSSQNNFGLLAAGNITIDNNKANNVYKGLFYSQSRIEIKTNDKPMTIDGGLIGNYTVDYPNMLTVINDPQYLSQFNLTDIQLIPEGRTYQ